MARDIAYGGFIAKCEAERGHVVRKERGSRSSANVQSARGGAGAVGDG